MITSLVSVIIVSFNTCDYLRNCLRSILLLPGSFEVIVVDNNSSDGSVDMLESEFGGQIKLIKNSINSGFGAANNIGANKAQGNILFFLNSDTIIKKNIWPCVVNTFSDNSLVIASPVVLQPDNQEQPYSYGKFFSIFNLLFDRHWHKLKQSTGIVDVDWVTGAALLIRRDVFEKIGGFDEKFFMYFEDMDLCRRAKKYGKIVSVRDISIIHFGGASLADNHRRKELYFSSQDYYFLKHHGYFQGIIVKIFRWFYNKLR